MPRRESRARPATPPAPAPPPPLDRSSLPLAIAFALLAGAVQWWLVHDLPQLPSAIFGGDWAYQEGCIRAILATGNPMASLASGHALPGYLPLYGVVAALFVKLTGLEVVRAMLVLSALVHAASTLVVFLVVSRHFGRRAGLAMACLWRLTYAGLIVKYTEFTGQLLVPLYFDALLLVLRVPRPRHALYLGLVLAALGYAHAVAFVSGIAIAAGATLWGAWARRGARGLRPELRAGGLALAIVAACSLFALGYWWRPLVEFHGHTSLHYAEWNGGEMVATPTQRHGFASRLLGRALWIGTPANTLLHALAIAGAAMLAFTSARRRFAAVGIVAALTFAWIFHFLLTVPLLHTHFVPEYVRYLLWTFAALLLAAAPAAWLPERVPLGRAALATGVALVLVATTGLALEVRAIAREPGTTTAREGRMVPPAYRSLQAWVYAHTRADAVVLSSNELSFGWSALTGRKALVSRRAQNDPFLDLDVRNKDAAIMLYGRDEAMRRERLRRWGIDYVLWSAEWAPLEFGNDARGNVVSVDPLFYFPNVAYDEELRRAGVQSVSVESWVDPYLRGPDFPEFELTIVTPANYAAPDHPWSRTLDPWLDPVWSYREHGRIVAALFHVRAAPRDSTAHASAR
jgi:hypothetical protein